MVLVTIALETAEDEARLIELLPTVHGRVVAKHEETPHAASTDDKTDNKQKAIDALKRLADRGGATSFGDASEWQREVRSWDKVLDDREE